MTDSAIREEVFGNLLRTASAAVQLELRERLRDQPDYNSLIATAYFANPFFRLTPEERESLGRSLEPAPLRDLMKARDLASRSSSPKFSVFCMPKSGSSFVQSALQHALQLPLVILTGVGTGRVASHFGMNAREQEFDEMALAKTILLHKDGFVAQNHTRHTLYLALQLQYYGVRPIVTFRNLLDSIVSFDDMMREWRQVQAVPFWRNDAQFPLPPNYGELDDARRYHLLAASYGTWLIAFYLSWMRGVRAKSVAPLVLRYEEHVLNVDYLVEVLAREIPMTPEQVARLTAYVRNPDREKARLNVGRSGRGREQVPQEVSDFLLDYLDAFKDEISEEERRYLIG